MRTAPTLLLLISLAISSFATIEQVKTDISKIIEQLNELDNSISALPDRGGSLTQALNVHNNANALKDSIDSGTTDVKATPPVSEDDAKSILTSIEAMAGTIEQTLTNVVSKKPAFQALPLGGALGIVKQDLTGLSVSASTFENALIAKAPSDLVDEAAGLKKRIDSAFSTAIAAYA